MTRNLASKQKKANRPSFLRRLSGPLIGAAFLVLLVGGGLYAFATATKPVSYTSSVSAVVEAGSLPQVRHLPTPEPLKAIYMSQCVVGTPSFRAKLVTLIEETELNAVVIDIKDYTGMISFPSDDPLLAPTVSNKCGAQDMEEFIRSLHNKGIYVIGRITVFQSPLHTTLHPEWAVKKKSDPSAVWKDYKGLSFVDVGARPYWEYVVALSKASYAIGFDELNYDYVRYPSDGPMSEVNATWSEGKNRPEVLESFFTYLHDQVKPTGAVMSADLFGMTTTNTDDLNIGQVLERALPHFDYIAPMVYPSHYPNSFLNLGNPNKHPYEVVHHSMAEAVRRAESTSTTIAVTGAPAIASTTPQLYTKDYSNPLKLRPWLQDFDYGGDYGPAEVRAQIKATYDAGLSSWMLWAPSNIYTKEALELASTTVVSTE